MLQERDEVPQASPRGRETEARLQRYARKIPVSESIKAAIRRVVSSIATRP